MKNIIDAFENGLYPKYKFLRATIRKRNLYTVKFSKKHIQKRTLFKEKFAYADGNRNIFEISNILKAPLQELLQEYRILKI